MVTITDIETARAILKGIIVETPVLLTNRLSQDVGTPVYVKAENTQRTGSFKPRGAYVKLASLSPEERHKGVITHSAGNHAQGLALAAKLLTVPATVVMPKFAPLAKVVATRRYGAEVILHGASFDEAGEHARSIQAQRGLTYVHAFDDEKTIAGQGTVGLELLEAVPDVDTVIVPVGGGGLIAGIAIAFRSRRPNVRIIGVQAEGCASIRLSLEAGRPEMVPQARTIADGIAVTRPGNLTLPVIRDLVDDVVTVDDDEIARGIVYALQNLALVVEGGGAVGIAALLSGRVRPRDNERVAVVLSGGNIDANFLGRVIEQVLVTQGRYVILHTTVLDRPSHLAQLVGVIGDAGANIIDIDHRRAAWQVPLDQVGIELLLEVRDHAHAGQVMDALRSAGYKVERAGEGEYPV
ncbi:MAG TPA: threonine ammonia-lyase [Ardenticatenaceae bacterium]|nr:threonine ammonia-lyase [Ardenticatenaceae bacterium]